MEIENECELMIHDFFRNEISDDDLDRLIEWLRTSDENKVKFLEIRNFYLMVSHEEKKNILVHEKTKQWEKLKSVLQQNGYGSASSKAKIISLFNPKKYLQIAAAAIAVIVAGFSVFLVIQNKLSKENRNASTVLSAKNNSVFSLQQKASLTLSNGQTILLDTLQSKFTGTDANARLVNKNGAIEYKSTGQTEDEVVFNTITTSRGGQYKLILADGTNVWLNTLSSLNYPVVFQGKERLVKLTGEAYFEVAKNDKAPFKVSINNQIIEVKGTHFNVNGYSNEATINTTLLEGKVKITTGKGDIELKPGQQSQVNSVGNIYLESNPDIAHTLTWRDGLLFFKNSAISDIVNQLERWFDFEIKVQGNFQDRKFSGNIPRTITLSELQRLFEVNKISCVVLNSDNGAAQKLIISPIKN